MPIFDLSDAIIEVNDLRPILKIRSFTTSIYIGEYILEKWSL